MAFEIFPKTFAPQQNAKTTLSDSDVAEARARFDPTKSTNLSYLLNKRYQWINQHLVDRSFIVELGCGSALGSYYYKKKVVLTDVIDSPWLHQKVDVFALPYEDNSVDAFICSFTIHHFAQPKLVLQMLQKKLKKHGILVIQEVENSLAMKLLLWITKVEGWSDEVDIFDDRQLCNDPSDPWSGNNSIPQMLFSDEDKFHNKLPGYKIQENTLSEFFVLILSGGVIKQRRTVQLPRLWLNVVNWLDRMFIRLAPKVFPLVRLVVLEKI